MRIPDIYKGLTALEGFPPEPQTSAPLIQFFNGEDLLFEGFLSYEDKPVVNDDWVINAVIKPGSFSRTSVWTGTVGDGIHVDASKPGYYKILVPSSAIENFASGTFWLDIFIKEQLGRSNNFRDRTVLVSRIPFGYDTSASSVNFIDSRNQGERTLPLATNITKL